MPTPRLHPRSQWTMSLFTTTLAVSFLVVGMPHILPCPVPPRALADGKMPNANKKRRRNPAEKEGVSEASASSEEDAEEDSRSTGRECPVPKPAGLVGQLLGFERNEPERRAIRIEPYRRRGKSAED